MTLAQNIKRLESILLLGLPLALLLALVGMSGTVSAAFSYSNQTRSSAYSDHSYFKSSVWQVPSGWTGSVNGCSAGVVSSAYTQATLDSINYVRGLAKLPFVVFNSAYTAGAQESALMSLANNDLNHSPPTNWECYTSAGASSSGSSNLCLGCSGPSAIAAYMAEYGSFDTLGHRRWILNGSAVEMGNGDTGASNTLHVISAANNTPVAGAPQFALWPSQGYFPAGLFPPLWSASAADQNTDISGASVSVTIDGQPITVETQQMPGGYADNAIAWLMPTQNFGTIFADLTVKVTISGLKDLGGSPIADYNYTTIIFDDRHPVTEAPDVPHWLSAGNVDGDGAGTSDLVHRHLNGINVWKSDGDGTYSLTGSAAPWFGYTFYNGEWLTPGDMNGDGDTDLVHRHGGGVNTWASDGDGTFTIQGFVKPSSFYAMNSGEWIAPGNVDGDIGGKADLVHRHANGLNVWKSDGDGTFTVVGNGAPWPGYSFKAGHWLSPGDIDGDGDADLIHRHSGGVNAWLSDGDGTFTIVGSAKPSPGYSMNSGEWLTPGDVDGDASDDLIHRHANGINVWESDGDGTFTAVGNGAPWPGYSFTAGEWLTSGDLDGDGDTDLVHRHSGGLNIWDSDGDGTFTIQSAPKPNPAYSMNSGEWLTPGNVDGDLGGKSDLLHRHTNGVNVWESEGDGTFSIVSNGPPWAGYSFE